MVDSSKITAIVPYVSRDDINAKSSHCNDLFNDGIHYPEFYQKMMTDNSISHEELEIFF